LWGALRVACTPDDRHGYRLAGFSVGDTLEPAVRNHLFRNSRCRGVSDLVREGCRLASNMIADLGVGFLGRGATGLVTNRGIRAEPLGALPLGLGQADALAVDSLTAAPGTVAGRTASGLPLNRPTTCGIAASRLGA
jgi:hypothetical protein